jgi:succinylglutamic semialdehyde dehydrogenase
MNVQEMISYNPYSGQPVGSVPISSIQDATDSFDRAKAAQKAWKKTGREERIRILRNYAAIIKTKESEISALICAESGKPLWESKTEVSAMANKIEISIDADSVRCGDFYKGPRKTRFHPLGVVGVLGPFNFPGHLPNGHIVPALLAGNAVLFKPSEQTPLVGQMIVDLLREAGVPMDVIQVLHGGAEIGEALVSLEGLKGLFFTGSARAGLAIHRALAGRPQTLLALEMGGNNPLLIDEVGDAVAAARLVCQSAFVTSGQRCTCARRLYVPGGAWGNDFVEKLKAAIASIQVGDPAGDPQPYLGTVISESAAKAVFEAESRLLRSGAQSLVGLSSLSGHAAALTPGLIDGTDVENRSDEECFGPLLQLIRYEDFEDAVAQCNETKYGLAAGIITQSKEKYDFFYREIETGIINLNTALTGASSSSPFGGLGLSGNYRPSAYFAADYCAYPTASLEHDEIAPAVKLPGFPLSTPDLS